MAIGVRQGTDKTSPCEACVKGKHSRKPFKSTGARSTKDLLELIHSDVCGPMPTASIGGAKYFVTFIDDFTRYCFVYFMNSKTEVVEKFKEFKHLVENQRIKALRTDTGLEYVNSHLSRILKNNGIFHEKTVAYSPEQNGLAERFNRTLLECMRSMLMDSGVGGDFWAEAIATAAYLKNRSPTKALKSVTPYEAWTKRKPDLRHLRIFGCKALVRIPTAFRKKLDSKSKECIFVGFSDNMKEYRLVDPVSKKLEIARYVVFFETQFMSSDNASPFDLNDELQERTTIPVVMKKNLVEINDGQREILQTPVEVGTSLSQDAEERSRRSHDPNNRIFNKQFVVNQAAQCERGDPTAVWETLSVAAAEAIWLKGLLLELMPSAPD